MSAISYDFDYNMVDERGWRCRVLSTVDDLGPRSGSPPEPVLLVEYEGSMTDELPASALRRAEEAS